MESGSTHQEAADPEHVSHVNAEARSDLVLPLGAFRLIVSTEKDIVGSKSVGYSRHDLSVGARDLDAGVQASLVVGFDDVTEDDLASTSAAVVRALGCRVAISGPGAIISNGTVCCRCWLPYQPNGLSLRSRKVYSCSRPNQGSCEACVSISLAHSWR